MTISNKSHFSTLPIITLAYKYFVSDPIGMGSFVGHAYPGSLFMVLALWWTVQMLQRYFRCKRFGTEYVASVAHKSQALPRVPIEPIFKMAVCTFGIVGEIIQGHYNDEFAPKNWHHATMFVFFGFSGLVDMLVHYGFRFPKNVDYSFSHPVHWGRRVSILQARAWKRACRRVFAQIVGLCHFHGILCCFCRDVFTLQHHRLASSALFLLPEGYVVLADWIYSVRPISGCGRRRPCSNDDSRLFYLARCHHHAIHVWVGNFNFVPAKSERRVHKSGTI